MEKFYLEKASIARKNDAVEYIKEHQEYNSIPAGTSGLDDKAENYESWLNKLELMSNPKTCPSDICCGIQYYLIRESDDKIVGTMNLRWNLNEWMLKYGGHIGYGIRPTERRKGYNKINLYLGLLKAQELGIEKVLITANDDNLGSIKTIQALDGILENKITSYKDDKQLLRRYWIDVNNSVNKFKSNYLQNISIERTIK